MIDEYDCPCCDGRGEIPKHGPRKRKELRKYICCTACSGTGKRTRTEALSDYHQREFELRELLSAFLDAKMLPGHVITDAQWNRACLLCGRWCEPFIVCMTLEEP